MRWDPREFQFCTICVYAERKAFISLIRKMVLFCFVSFHSFYFIIVHVMGKLFVGQFLLFAYSQLESYLVGVILFHFISAAPFSFLFNIIHRSYGIIHPPCEQRLASWLTERLTVVRIEFCVWTQWNYAEYCFNKMHLREILCSQASKQPHTQTTHVQNVYVSRK